MPSLEQAEVDTSLVTFAVRNARPVHSKALFALVDVEVQLAGVAFLIQGVQARRLPEGGTSVHLPTSKDADGTWCPAIQMPGEVHGRLADTVLAFLVEEGLTRPKFEPSAVVSALAGLP